jgi:hypothetical protein
MCVSGRFATLAKRQSRSADSRKRLLALLSVALVILVHRLRARKHRVQPACRWSSLPPHRAVWLELSRVLERLADLLPWRTAQPAQYLQRVQAAVHQRVQARTREMVQLSMRRLLKHLQPLAQQQLEQSVEGMLDRTALHVRVTLKDEAMPPIVQRGVDDLVDGLLRLGLGLGSSACAAAVALLDPNPCRHPNHHHQVAGLLRDVKLECWRWTDERFTTAVDRRSLHTSFSPLTPRPRRRSFDRPVPSLPPPSPLLHTLRYARAWTLHTLWPHDRSFWSCTRRVRWWVLQLTGMVPYLGQIWWLALIAVLDRQDEYQLCNFIVGLRCAQFLTFGLGASGYACTLSAASGLAAPSGGAPSRLPQLSPWGGLFWAMQLTLGWRAFALLPASQKKGQRVAPPEPHAGGGHARRAGALDARARGGVLMRLQTFDLSLALVALVLAALAALSAATGVGTSDPRALRLSLFWIRTCHGLLCCPYLLFKLPVLDTLLTHARKTGYDELGHTVPFRAVPFEPALRRRPSK